MTYPEVLAILIGLIENSRHTEKQYFHYKNLGYVFLCGRAYRNFEKILGNLNVYPNIIGVKPIHPKTLGCVNYISPEPLAQ